MAIRPIRYYRSRQRTWVATPDLLRGRRACIGAAASIVRDADIPAGQVETVQLGGAGHRRSGTRRGGTTVTKLYWAWRLATRVRKPALDSSGSVAGRLVRFQGELLERPRALKRLLAHVASCNLRLIDLETVLTYSSHLRKVSDS